MRYHIQWTMPESIRFLVANKGPGWGGALAAKWLRK